MYEMSRIFSFDSVREHDDEEPNIMFNIRREERRPV